MLEFILTHVLSYTVLSISLFFIPVVMLCLSAKVILEYRTVGALKLLGISHGVLLLCVVILLMIIANETVTANVVMGYGIGFVLLAVIVLSAGLAWIVRYVYSMLIKLSAPLRRRNEAEHPAFDHSLT